MTFGEFCAKHPTTGFQFMGEESVVTGADVCAMPGWEEFRAALVYCDTWADQLALRTVGVHQALCVVLLPENVAAGRN
jgi:hypothetical protein